MGRKFEFPVGLSKVAIEGQKWLSTWYVYYGSIGGKPKFTFDSDSPNYRHKQLIQISLGHEKFH